VSNRSITPVLPSSHILKLIILVSFLSFNKTKIKTAQDWSYFRLEALEQEKQIVIIDVEEDLE
jgi:hypothetical protein